MKIFGTGYSSPLIGRHVMRGGDVAKDTPGVGMDPAITESHLIGKVDQQLGLPILCANNGGGMTTQTQLSTSDLPDLLKSGGASVIQRMESDLAVKTDWKDIIGYCGDFLRSVTRSSEHELDSAVLEVVSFLCEKMAGVIDVEFGGDVTGIPNDEIGDMHNMLARPQRYVHQYERNEPEILNAADKERIADILYTAGTLGVMYYREYDRVALLVTSAAQRYRILGLEEKAIKADTFLTALRSKTNIDDPREALAAAFGSVSETAELVILTKNAPRAMNNLTLMANDAGYQIAEWYYNELADELSQQEGGESYVQFYRDKAVEAHRIGVALGLIEE